MIWPFARTPARAGRLAITPPAPQAGRAGLALVIIARNEAGRIGDWLAFHALAGVAQVYLYDDGSTDGTAAIAARFTGCPVMVIPWAIDAREAKSGMVLPRQVLAYAHAICTFGGGFARMGFVDADEYIVPQGHDTIPAALTAAGLDGQPNLSLPWVMFGHDGHDSAPDDALPFAYRSRAATMAGPLLNYKCLVDPCTVTQVSPHKFETAQLGDRSANTRGALARNRARTGAFVTTDHLQLNHYYLMSRVEMQAKMAARAVSGTPPARRGAAIAEKAALIEAAPVPDHAATAFLARHGITATTALRARFAPRSGGCP